MAIIPTSGEFTKVPEGGGSALPAVTKADNGKVLSVVNGAWKAADKQFLLVTCTPTAEDFSGTMDKTVDEIVAAYTELKSIYFQVANVGTFLATVYTNGSLGTNIVDRSTDHLIHVYTAKSGNRYYTKIYQLTPMGS